MGELTVGLLLPFVGTALGAACVFFMRDRMAPMLRKSLVGFAAGVMVAASVWSLLIPAMESAGGGLHGVFAASVGFIAGVAFLLMLDRITPHEHPGDGLVEGPRSHLSHTSKLVLAVTLHTIPEGLAVGVSLAAAIEHNAYISMAAAIALSVGIAIQNFPEGAIVSMPLRAAGNSRSRSLAIGVLSGVVEPVAALIALLCASVVVPALPYLLAFAAGAMIYVVVEELIPETQEGEHSNSGTLGFAAGFVLMMILDVVLG